MFYSQFILAKKGPLGTIWIAAHLERKLRKNQVADTDIGVSVDSILFPEAPIALRLSSHLLLGVVRIYSRKVNYLFHDCSEALLKIKQAFRSTAVDLPPEESTAPYHSITLPETFHLDDFELPDNTFGNFVDHHVSTKEQITLQDTLNTTGCSTSQFGLDERFGDGDASQIGLDLDEDLFLDKDPPSQHALVPLGSEDVIHQDLASIPVTDMDVDDRQNMYDEDRDGATPKNFPEFLSNGSDNHVHSDVGNPKRNDDSFHRHGYNPRTPDLNEVFTPDVHVSLGFGVDDVASPDLTEFAHAPSTPGLTEEAIPANFQEMPDFSPQEKALPPTDVVPAKPDHSCGPPDTTKSNDHMHAVMMLTESAVTAQAVSSPTIILTEQSGLMPASNNAHLESGQKSVHNSENEFLSNEKDNIQVSDQVLDNGEAILPEETRLDGLVSKSCHLEAPNMGTPLDKCLDNPEQVVLTDIPTGNKLVSEAAASERNSTVLDDKAEQLIPNNLKVVQGAVSCPSIDVPALSEANVLSLQDRILENVPEVSNGGPSCLTETPERGALNVAGFSIEVQGEDSPAAHVTDGNHCVHQKSDDIFLGHKSGDNNLEERSIGDVSKDAQLDHLNCSSSSEFPEPEKMVLAPADDMNFPNDLGQLTTEKGVSESDGSVDRINKVSGRKRRLAESTPILQNCSSAKLSGKPRFRRNSEYVPDDDDLLASILVGRRPSSLRMGPTPPPLKVASLKRPRLTSRVGMHKRKVLLDDTMVLHADAIRQQLINTEDIRRMRKKAPCTRPEIWMIEKCSKEEIFDETLLSGVSVELYSLHTRSYLLNENPCSQVEHQSHAEPSKETELSRSSEIAGETCGKEKGEPVTVMSGEVHMQGTSGSVISAEAHSCKDLIRCDVQEQIGSQPIAVEQQISNNNETCAVFITEMDKLHKESAVLDVSKFSASHSVNKMATPEDGVIIEASIHNNDVDDLSPGKGDGVWRQQDKHSVENLAMEMNDSTLHLCESVPPEGPVSVEDAVRGRMVDDTSPFTSDKTLLRTEDSCDAKGAFNESRGQISVEAVGNLENGETMLDSSLLGVCSLSADDLREVVQPAEMATITDHQVIEEKQEIRLDVAVGDEVVVEKLLTNGDGPPSEMVCPEMAQVGTTQSIEQNTETENLPSTVGENSGIQEFNQEGNMDVESTSMDFGVAREASDFCSAIEGNGTEFLNVDDETDFDEGDVDVPNPEETQSFENCGWSSRTRGVARYLKSLFDDEYGRGRKVVAMDHLLAGKTRKEASRMFFETLVLKTRDYIDVEQEKSFDFVKIRPRTKLLKSEF